MSKYRVLPRRLKEGDTEKCPVCRNGWQNFMDIDGSLLGCFVCGCVFVSKKTRIDEKAGIKDQIAVQEAGAKGIKTDAIKKIENEIMAVDDRPPIEEMKYVPNQKWLVETPVKARIKVEVGSADSTCPAVVPSPEIADNPYKCQVCEKELKNKAGLLCHMRSHKESVV